MKYKAAALLTVLILHNVVTLSERGEEDETVTDERISVRDANIEYNKIKEIFSSYNFIINYDPQRNNDKLNKLKTLHNNHVGPLLKSEYYQNLRPELKLKRFGRNSIIYRNSNDDFTPDSNLVEDKSIFESRMISDNNKVSPESKDFDLDTQKNDSQDSLKYSYGSLGHDDELSYYYNNHSNYNRQKFNLEHSNNYTSGPQSDVNYYDLVDFDNGEESALGLGSSVKKSQKYEETKNNLKQLYDQTRPQLTQHYIQPFHNRYQPEPRNPVQMYVYSDYQNPINQLPHKQYPQPPIFLPPYNPFQPPPKNGFQPPPHNQFQPQSNNHKGHSRYPSLPAKQKLKSTTYAPYTQRPLNHKLNLIGSTTPSAPKLITPNIDTEIDDCEFGNTWTMNCYHCVCNGSTAICIRDLHCTPPPQNEPKLCKPYTSFPLDGSICHRCECNADGLPVCAFDYYACSRRIKQKFYRIKGQNEQLRKTNQGKVDSGYDSLKLPLLTTSQNTCPKVVIDFNVLKCQPRSKWTARCYICECDSEGQPRCVKILNCVPAPFGIPTKCKPGSILSIEGCQKCWCDDDGFPAGDIPPPKVQGLGAKKALSAPLSDALNEIFASFLNPSFNNTNPLTPFSGSLEDHDAPSSLGAPVDDTDPLDSLPASIEVTNISSHSASIEDNDASSSPTLSLYDADVNSPPNASLEQSD